MVYVTLHNHCNSVTAFSIYFLILNVNRQKREPSSFAVSPAPPEFSEALAPASSVQPLYERAARLPPSARHHDTSHFQLYHIHPYPQLKKTDWCCTCLSDWMGEYAECVLMSQFYFCVILLSFCIYVMITLIFFFNYFFI